MNKKIPGWIVAVVGALFRFVAGSVGAKVPHPWPTGFCWPFWVAIVGVTAGLPIVLAFWGIKLAFRSKKARKAARIVFWILYLGWIAYFLWFIFISLLWLLGTIKLLLAIAGLVVAILAIWGIIKLIARIVGLVRNTEGYQRRQAIGRERENQKRLERLALEKPVEAKERKTGPGPVKWFFIKIWEAMSVIGLVIYAAFKKFCPRVEFP